MFPFLYGYCKGCIKHLNCYKLEIIYILSLLYCHGVPSWLALRTPLIALWTFFVCKSCISLTLSEIVSSFLTPERSNIMCTNEAVFAIIYICLDNFCHIWEIFLVGVSSKVSIHSSGIIRLENCMMMLYMDYRSSLIHKILFSYVCCFLILFSYWLYSPAVRWVSSR